MIACSLLIGFLPLSFVNSVTQYVLIAIDQQRFLTKAFLIGVSFNVVANLLVIPTYSYRGAAVVTILSEFALLIPFYYAVRKHLGPAALALPLLATGGCIGGDGDHHVVTARALLAPADTDRGCGLSCSSWPFLEGSSQPDMNLLAELCSLPAASGRGWPAPGLQTGADGCRRDRPVSRTRPIAGEKQGRPQGRLPLSLD
jgi:hypothetical protein